MFTDLKAGTIPPELPVESGYHTQRQGSQPLSRIELDPSVGAVSTSVLPLLGLSAVTMLIESGPREDPLYELVVIQIDKNFHSHKGGAVSIVSPVETTVALIGPNGSMKTNRWHGIRSFISFEVIQEARSCSDSQTRRARLGFQRLLGD